MCGLAVSRPEKVITSSNGLRSRVLPPLRNVTTSGPRDVTPTTSIGCSHPPPGAPPSRPNASIWLAM